MGYPPALKFETVPIYAAFGSRVCTFLFVGNANVISGCREAAAKQAMSRK
jgi:hypothetical protein